ncbi:enoyl-CoA hydratase [Cutaneotrichosporon oleaginosum]|uniref:Enoyl-CoA hydratase n=1 Tax=Cutaneotrichosporon oleaginosum TaxID=879819 RepID=A0A0J0XZD4_9TREE|nr:enoyl-CoA hydratase [Cutaneotrichosporon oleaginosum]KLT46398.1 enoyl-CoA hydratase [Cutaneotrichosporon oleaginosum]TXT15232.1 hypothetical protein COLE_01425 [Cutaneotrichosporon oleaginosum]
MRPFNKPPPSLGESAIRVSFPAEHVLHVAIDRPDKFNALRAIDSFAMDDIWEWYESEPSLRCAILGTTNPRAWCAGGDLKELSQRDGRKAGKYLWPDTGLGGLAKRFLRKPVIAAVNGVVIGGAVEMLSNLDVVIAGESAKLSLPEAKRGVAAAGGGLPRFVFLIGRQKSAELLMTGRDIPAWEAEKLGLVNMVVPDDQVEARALQMAKETAANAPDSVQLCLFGLRLTEEEMGYQRMMARYTQSKELKALNTGPNLKEGLQAFIEKRAPRWHDPKL